MTIHRIAVIATALSVTVAATSAAQESAGWARVATLKPGTMIVVVVRDSAPMKRRFVIADDDSLALSEDRNLQVIETIAKADIVEIKAPKRRGTVRKVAFGVVGYFAGGIAGGMLGMYVTRSFSGMFGAFPGAAVGILVGVRGGFPRPDEVIFSR